MAKNVKVVLYRKNVKDQIHYGRGVDTAGALSRAAGMDAEIDQSSNARGGGRLRARIYGSLEDESKNGTLSRRLGRGA